MSDNFFEDKYDSELGKLRAEVAYLKGENARLLNFDWGELKSAQTERDHLKSEVARLREALRQIARDEVNDGWQAHARKALGEGK